jgi:hypothetical protein
LAPTPVGEAIAAYIKSLDGRSACRDTKTRLAAHVPVSLAARAVDGLTREDLSDWHRDLAKQLPRVRSAGAGVVAHKDVDLSDPEIARGPVTRTNFGH